MKFQLLAISLSLLSIHSHAGKYDYLDKYDLSKSTKTLEQTDQTGYEHSRPIHIDLTPFYKEFEKDGIVTLYSGFGAETWYSQKVQIFFDMLKTTAEKEKLPLSQFAVDLGKMTITFYRGNIKYFLQIGFTRESFIDALSKYEIVNYNGHSRYGRGPAFEDMSNYFRMGDRFDTVEVDVRNRYFLNETILQTNQFPLMSITLGDKNYNYQYIGEKDHTSHLPKDAYTKIIEGADADLRAAKYKPGRQIFFFHSCSNEGHWKDSFRYVMPDPSKKLVFGTMYDSFGNLGANSVLFTQLASLTADSTAVLSEVNEIEGCSENPCYTTY